MKRKKFLPSLKVKNLFMILSGSKKQKLKRLKEIMYKPISFRLTGSAPLIMHSSQTANPLNKFAKALKEISSKRKKTDADYENMANIEWQAGLYLNQDLKPMIPGYVIEAALVAAAKKKKMGRDALSGMFCDGGFELKYKGNSDLTKLMKDENFRLVVPVNVQRAKIMRTRPKFDEWSAVVTINYDDEVLTESQMVDFMQICGTNVGICDWRPRYGRFVAEKL
jgi:hypothetical protein